MDGNELISSVVVAPYTSQAYRTKGAKQFQVAVSGTGTVVFQVWVGDGEPQETEWIDVLSFSGPAVRKWNGVADCFRLKVTEGSVAYGFVTPIPGANIPSLTDQQAQSIIFDATAGMGRVYQSYSALSADYARVPSGVSTLDLNTGDYWVKSSGQTSPPITPTGNIKNQSVESIAALRTYAIKRTGIAITVRGYYVAGDEGGGDFLWKDVATYGSRPTEDNAIVVYATGDASGWWERLYDGTISVLAFGAKGDNSFDNSSVFQSALNFAESKRLMLYIPSGTYYLASTVATKHTGTYYRNDSGIRIYGDGPTKTFITRKETAPSGVADYSSEAIYRNQAAIRVQGSYNIIDSLCFIECKIGLFFGQDTSTVEPSHTSFNRIRNLQFKDCGTGILSSCAQGHYYNTYEDIHITQCQFGIHWLRGPYSTAVVANNNRNNFKSVRASRCRIGFYMQNGGTNTSSALAFEGCDAGAPITYPFPTGIVPAAVTVPSAMVFDTEATDNYMYDLTVENCDLSLYNNGYGNSFGGLLNEDVPSEVIMVEALDNLITRSSIISKAFYYVSNAIGGVYSGLRAGYLYLTRKTIYQNDFDFETSKVLDSYVHMDLGSFTASQTKQFTLQAGADRVQASGAFSLECEIISTCTANSLMHGKKFTVVGWRNGSRTPTRYWLNEIYDYIANGGNAGSAATTEKFTVVLSVSGRNLLMDVTAPNRVLDRVSLRVRDHRVIP